MGMSPGIYGPSDDAESVATIRAAIEAGITPLHTGDFYGMGHNEMLIRRALEGVPTLPCRHLGDVWRDLQSGRRLGRVRPPAAGRQEFPGLYVAPPRDALLRASNTSDDRDAT